MSKLSITILFAAITLILIATYFDIAYLGGGPGMLITAGLCYAFHIAKREASLMTYILTENQILQEQPAKKPAPVRQGTGETLMRTP